MRVRNRLNRRMVVLTLLGEKINQMAVVCKQPIFAPHLAHEGMSVRQRGLALRGLADMGDNVFRLDLIGAHQVGNGRVGAGFVVVNKRTPLPSKKPIPKPSAWWSVMPPRRRKPSKENMMSVGVLQFMPSSWHMVLTFILGYL